MSRSVAESRISGVGNLRKSIDHGVTSEKEEKSESEPQPPRQTNNGLAAHAVQLRAARELARGTDAPAIAEHGTSTASSELPHREAIQASFGSHEVGHVRAQVGGAATEAADDLSAEAFAFGDRVGFREQPDLHTAAHEAAHVVQQQRGVQLAGGVGAAGDVYEQHADEVADRVVAGESAEELLNDGPRSGGSERAVQRQEAGAEKESWLAWAMRQLGLSSSRVADTGQSTPNNTLETAMRLMQELDVPYEASPAKECKELAGEGNEEDLEQLNCGLFSALTLAVSGTNLDALYKDVHGNNIAYLEEDGTMTWVTQLRVINTELETTAALLQTQRAIASNDPGASDPAVELVQPGSERARQLELSRHNENQPEASAIEKPFWLNHGSSNFVGMDAAPGMQFGVGASVISLGGEEIAPHDRRPGDFQQALTTDKESDFAGTGHSSQVHSVLGPGVCYFDPNDPTSPVPHELEGGATPDVAGWYEIERGKGAWEIGPETDPQHVASFEVRAIRLIDANHMPGRDGRDQAIGIGVTAPTTPFKTGTASTLYSIGRMEGSPWFKLKLPPARNVTKL